MMRNFFKLTNSIITGMVFATSAQAAGWNETVQGDLSNNGFAPSVLQLSVGSNPVLGNFGKPDIDYLAVIVPDGTQLSALRYGQGNVIGGVRSFIGVQAGDQMTVLPTTESAEGLLGWAHVQDAATGTDFLPEIGVGYGAIGFTGPLSAGIYTFWLQDTSHEPGLAFSWDLEVAAIPEPETYAMLVGGLGLMGFAAKRRNNKK